MTSANSKGSECKGSGTLAIRHRTRTPGRFPPAAWPSGLGKGLQSPVHRFDSGRRLEAFSQVNPAVVADHAFEAPSGSGIHFHDLLTVSLGGVGVIEHVINSTGGATPSNTTPVNITSYP